jgi:amino acid adenylation domain-containing protein
MTNIPHVEQHSKLSPERRAALLEQWRRQRAAPKAAQISPSAQDGPLPLAFAQERIWFLHQMQPDSPGYHLPIALRLVGELHTPALERSFAELIRRHAILRTTFPERDGMPAQVITPIETHNYASLQANYASLQTNYASLQTVDLRPLAEDRREPQARRLADEEYARPFDLTTGPLLRARLFRLADQEHLLLITLHHLVSDGWSNGILLKELGELYGAYAAGLVSPLPELAVQYADIVAWERKRFQAGALDNELAYWKRRLEGAPALLALPLDHLRPAVQSAAGAVHQFQLPSGAHAALQALCRRAGVTPVMALLAVFKTLLYRYTGQDDLLIGLPVFNRHRSESEGLIGLFVNTLVIRTLLAGNPGFLELLGRVRAATLGAYEHQSYPFEKLVEVLRPERDTSHTPLFQVMLSVTAGAEEESHWPGLNVLPYEVERPGANFDLTLEVAEHAAGMQLALVFRTELFERSTIERLANHFCRLLEACLRAPETPIERLPLLSAAERALILEGWNATQVGYPQVHCLHQLFEQQAERTPNAVALEYAGQQLTYRQLNGRANQLAHFLRERGVGPEVLVGISVERSLELVIGLLGILKAGGAYVPMDPSYPAERLQYMLEDAQVAVLLTMTTDDRRPTTDPFDTVTIRQGDKVMGTSEVFTPSPFHPFTPSEQSVVGGQRSVVDLVADWDQIAQQPAENPESGAAPDNLAYMIYTSGSTGKPKGAMNSHRAIVNRLMWMQQEYGLTAADRVLQKTPFSFDVSVWEFFWPLISGARLVVARPEGHKDPAYLVELIASAEITTLHFVPSMLQLFVEQPGLERCVALRRVICSGEALAYDLQQRFFERSGAELHNLYGPTEAAVDVTYWACRRDSARQSVPLGYPVANTQIYILDRRMQPVPIGVAGELHIGGVQVGRGYHNRPELTAERFVPNPFATTDDRRPTTDDRAKTQNSKLKTQNFRLYRTGDLARYLPDGTIEYLGRIDHQVKIRGLRIELGEIEAALSAHPSVREAVVLAREAAPGDTRLMAYIVPDQEQRTKNKEQKNETPDSQFSILNSQFSIQELRRFLGATLPEYMVPSAFVVLEAMPLNPSGKVDRKALPAPELAASHAQAEYIAPRNDVERTIAEIWQGLLHIPRVGTQDNFFELGGHSLLVTQVRAQIQERLGADISLVDLFRLTTVQALAQHLGRRKAEQPSLQPTLNRAELRRQAMQRSRERR